ncbi:MAG TPA: GNAT family N-acetyltransferase [Stellaceae bacterium]|nr:GNAT family N-acetyltransferase [Stellaceae bacterium]
MKATRANPSILRPAIMPLAQSHLPVAAVLHARAFGAEAWNEAALRDVLAMPGAFGALALARSPDMISEPARGAPSGLGTDSAPQAEPVGFYIGLALGREVELLTLGVIPGFRSQGYGKSLVEHFMDCAKRAGAIEAFLEVAADNETAIRLYRSLDFHQVGRRRDYYERPGNTRISALVLRRLFP